MTVAGGAVTAFTFGDNPTVYIPAQTLLTSCRATDELEQGGSGAFDGVTPGPPITAAVLVEGSFPGGYYTLSQVGSTSTSKVFRYSSSSSPAIVHLFQAQPDCSAYGTSADKPTLGIKVDLTIRWTTGSWRVSLWAYLQVATDTGKEFTLFRADKTFATADDFKAYFEGAAPLPMPGRDPSTQNTAGVVDAPAFINDTDERLTWWVYRSGIDLHDTDTAWQVWISQTQTDGEFWCDTYDPEL